MTWIYNGTPELDAQSTYKTGLVVCLVVPAVMAVVVGLRLYTRLRVVCKVGADDYLTVSAAIFATAYAALWITQTRLGLGLIPADRPPENLPQYGRQNYAGRPVYVFSTLCFKLALCISYLRLTRGAHNGPARAAIWIGLVFTLLYNIAYILTLLFACSPVAASWDYSIEGKCLSMRPYYYTTGVLTMLNDLALFILPLPLIWRLRMNKRTKLGLSVMFLLGLVTTFCSTMRIVAITYIERTGNTTAFILWGVVEACVGTMTSSIPALRPLLRDVKKKAVVRVRGPEEPAFRRQKFESHRIAISSLPGMSEMTTDSRQDSAFGGTQVTEISDDGSEYDMIRHDSVQGGFLEQLTYAITRTTEIHISTKTASEASRAVTVQSSEKRDPGN